ncbi:RING finger and SPRY domain-containing protein 1-like [Chrysoperla carnea]|uniref:RING finger and SPRY domain-containing protein 1-like n=1 Tax=Chrysoperla carnea TaxID=189513 RepID=UPI001D08163F|nr:RING finger and SPRY domain-containing protein 1-like [Chrysoperla carnea]
MGACCCTEKVVDSDTYCPQTPTVRHVEPINQNMSAPRGLDSIFFHAPTVPRTTPDPATVDKLVLETLGVIGFLVDNEQEPPPSMHKIHTIADNEEGWIQVVTSMVNVIPMWDPLGPSVITLLLDDCPLPSRDSVLKVAKLFDLSTESAIRGKSNPRKQRNICVVLGCIAEKLAGPSSIAILSEGTLDYLITNLNEEMDPHVILFSMISLEKFAQTSENKAAIKRRLEQELTNPLILLEKWRDVTDFVKRQVGFCAQWCLDNLFLTEGRQYSYELVDMACINAMLNTADVSEYLKISPDGLEARCDAYSFESVRCTAQADEGVWYYEALIVTPGVMQIGWATKNSSFLNHEGYGIGDDAYSIAYDGCRRLIWHNAKSEPQEFPCWKPGDILGCLLDLNMFQVIFYINGSPLPPCTQVFNNAKSGFFAAASFMSFQQCRFNFGSEPFLFPPPTQFNTFNENCSLKAEDKRVVPRHVFLEQLRRFSVNEDSCTLCFDQKASVRLSPCNHRGFCTNCTNQLTECPMCRSPINFVLVDGL